MPVYNTLAEQETISKKNKHKTEGIIMQSHHKKDIITLSKHPAFEKRELFTVESGEKSMFGENSTPEKKDMDFIETLFRFLGTRRQMVISFVRMKLDGRTRILFSKEIKMCRNVREESRCVKRYFGHLKTNDATALLVSLIETLSGKIEALIYHGEDRAENRLKKFIKTFSLSESDVTSGMLFLLLARKNIGGQASQSIAAPFI
jgi:hypothetical protein